MKQGPVGVFDSGYGGLSILAHLQNRLPQYSYVYLGDNARAPYGTRPFDQVYQYTLQAVQYLFDRGCPLVILACNTASAKALRTIQQRYLPTSDDPTRRVLGVIRPTAEAVGHLSRNGHVGVVATPGTIASGSYDIEIKHLNPEFAVTGHACPMWVPLVEYDAADTPGADWFVGDDLAQLFASDPLTDTLLLGCTHYPHLLPLIRRHTPEGVKIVDQGPIVADSLADYLGRHPEMAERLCVDSSCQYLTTTDASAFSAMASQLLGHPVAAQQVKL